MRIFHRAEDLKAYRSTLTKQNRSMGFVPTMGALHEAHLALAQRAMAENDVAVVSIFINPTQFNNAEDLEKYPRRFEEDRLALEQAGVEVIFYPEVEEIYGQEVQPEPIDLRGLDEGMEGRHRPGHFPGVATVIKRFFEIIAPDRAYFGQKDYQQLRVIEHMTKALGFDTVIVGCPTQRLANGLAMSSRNYRLSTEGIAKAAIIYQQISWAAQHCQQYRPAELKEAIEQAFAQSDLQLEYVEIADPESMQPLQDFDQARHARIFMAAFCEGVRLIDNDKLF